MNINIVKLNMMIKIPSNLKLFSAPSNKAAAALCLAVFSLGFMPVAHAQILASEAGLTDDTITTSDQPPLDLTDLQSLNLGFDYQQELDSTAVRKEAMRDAAISYGARAGLARRTWEIVQDLERSTPALDKTYDFRRLLVAQPSGLQIEPPVVSEQMNALIVGNQGQNAAVADRILQINAPARIVTAPRNWRTYMIRNWGEVRLPPGILQPQTAAERPLFEQWVAEGWNLGTAQAEQIFEQDLNRLTRDYTGMVRYRMLLAQGMVTEPVATSKDRGITGGGQELRVGDRALAITVPSKLEPKSVYWEPTDR